MFSWAKKSLRRSKHGGKKKNETNGEKRSLSSIFGPGCTKGEVAGEGAGAYTKAPRKARFTMPVFRQSRQANNVEPAVVTSNTSSSEKPDGDNVSLYDNINNKERKRTGDSAELNETSAEAQLAGKESDYKTGDVIKQISANDKSGDSAVLCSVTRATRLQDCSNSEKIKTVNCTSEKVDTNCKKGIVKNYDKSIDSNCSDAIIVPPTLQRKTVQCNNSESTYISDVQSNDNDNVRIVNHSNIHRLIQKIENTATAMKSSDESSESLTADERRPCVEASPSKLQPSVDQSVASSVVGGVCERGEVVSKHAINGISADTNLISKSVENRTSVETKSSVTTYPSAVKCENSSDAELDLLELQLAEITGALKELDEPELQNNISGRSIIEPNNLPMNKVSNMGEAQNTFQKYVSTTPENVDQEIKPSYIEKRLQSPCEQTNIANVDKKERKTHDKIGVSGEAHGQTKLETEQTCQSEKTEFKQTCQSEKNLSVRKTRI